MTLDPIDAVPQSQPHQVQPRPHPAIDFVLHGHFYQPPREDPWTGVVPEQPEAGPFHDWNERVTAECYAPLAELGAFELLSHNVGPTLLSWLEAHHPEVYGVIIEADRRAGRAIGQAYGHAILPLCDDHDRRTHVRWGITDFVHRYGRRPEGMWLPETAVDDPTLVVLADEGIRFTILAPGQIAATRPLDGAEGWVDHGEGAPVPLDRPLRWQAVDGSGRGVDLVVYDGALAHDLAFASPTAAAIIEAARTHSREAGGLLAAATDGETFGHHRAGADEVVVEALMSEAARQGVQTPRLRDVLEGRPPTREARVRTSAWSCAHGVDRWKADCGCHTGGSEGWTQAWRAPLRQALDVLRDWGVALMDGPGRTLLRDPWAARDDYLALLLGARSWEDFAGEHIVGDGHRAGLLLDAQRNAVLMYTSCGWFFNDLGGTETVQILRYAARAIDLYQQLGEQPPVDAVVDALASARSNDPVIGDGRRVWHDRVLPAHDRG